MRDLLFMPKAWQDMVQNDIKIVKKIYSLLENTIKYPFDGIGQQEPLKANYSGYWSRRINLEHRIIYKVEDTQIVVISVKGHYN